MTDAQWALVLPVLLALAINIGGYISNRRFKESQVQVGEGEAAEKLSDAAQKIIQTYEGNVVKPLKDRIEELTQQLSVMGEDQYNQRCHTDKEINDLKLQQAHLLSQIEFMKGELRRSDSALELLAAVAQQQFPHEVDRALKMRRGQLDLS